MHKTIFDSILVPPEGRSTSFCLVNTVLPLVPDFATKTGLELSVPSMLLEKNQAVWKGSVML